jgi:hypothetical protein
MVIDTPTSGAEGDLVAGGNVGGDRADARVGLDHRPARQANLGDDHIVVGVQLQGAHQLLAFATAST